MLPTNIQFHTWLLQEHMQNMFFAYCPMQAQHPELMLSISKDAWNPQEYDACPLQRIGAAGEAVAMNSRQSSLQGSRRNSRRVSSASGHGGFAGNQGSKFHITINPSKQLQLILAYRPSAVHKQAFELTFNSLTSGQSMSQPLRRVVTAEGVQPRLVVSKTAIDFGTCIVIRSNQIKAPYSTDIWLTNNEAEPVTVAFGEPTGKNSEGLVFTITPNNLVVNPGKEFIQHMVRV